MCCVCVCVDKNPFILYICFKRTVVYQLRQKEICGTGSPTDPIFSANSIIFLTGLTMQHYFLRMVAD